MKYLQCEAHFLSGNTFTAVSRLHHRSLSLDVNDTLLDSNPKLHWTFAYAHDGLAESKAKQAFKTVLYIQNSDAFACQLCSLTQNRRWKKKILECSLWHLQQQFYTCKWLKCGLIERGEPSQRAKCGQIIILLCYSFIYISLMAQTKQLCQLQLIIGVN